jgi:hypothetical protein
VSAGVPGGPPALPVTFRPLVTRVVLLTMAAALLVTLTTVAVLMPEDGAGPWSTGDRVTVSLTAALISAVLVLLARPKVVADAEGLTVVNLVTRRRLAWPQVIRVSLRDGDAWVHLDLADGTTLPAMGIQPGLARRRALRDARLLRDLAQTLGEARDPSPLRPE